VIADHIGFLALSFSSIADARNATGRLQECFTAELISDMFEQDPELKHALEVENASFTWDSPPPDEGKEQKEKKKGRRASSNPEPTSETREVKEENLFKLKQIDFKVPRGQLLAIVGAVGSGKTSLLQGLIGDMRKTEGSVRFGGSLAYCSQSAWIQVSYPLKIIEIQSVNVFYRMQQFGITFASVGPSSLSVIGRLYTMLVWRMTLMYFQTAI
jgi:ABC-type multidrug transport system fused ATPase/permease subunit